MASLLKQLKERKLVQWAMAYLAGAWLLWEVSDSVGGRLGWPDLLFKVLFVLLFVGFLAAVTVAWYHGEQGRQKVSGAELVILALLCGLGALGLSVLWPRPNLGVVAPTQPTGAESVEDFEQLPGIAVLPFANRSGVPEDEYFTSGFHDELLTRLQRTGALRVVSRTSVEAYRDRAVPTPEIGAALGVEYVLEGGVQRSGGRVRINLQLIAAGADEHVWAETYDRDLTPASLFDVQTEVVESVAAELDITLRETDRERAARRTTTDAVAYDLFMRGWDAWRHASVFDAARLFEEAAERDPTFLVAQAMTAETAAWIYSTSERTRSRAELAKDAAERALALDSASEDAQMAMGFYYYRVQRDYPIALAWFARSAGTLRGDDRYQEAKAYMERRTGQWLAAVRSLERAAKLSPGSTIPRRELAETLTFLRRYGEAEQWLQQCEAVPGDAPQCDSYLGWLQWMRDGSPNAWLGRRGTWRWQLCMSEGDVEGAVAALDEIGDAWSSGRFWYPTELLRAWSYEVLGDTTTARESYSRAASILEEKTADDPQDERYHAALGLTYSALGRRDDAVREAERAVELLPVNRDAYVGPHQLFTLAAVHARLGDVEAALPLLEDILTMPSRFSGPMLRGHYLLASLQLDPRFQALIEREPGRVF